MDGMVPHAQSVSQSLLLHGFFGYKSSRYRKRFLHVGTSSACLCDQRLFSFEQVPYQLYGYSSKRIAASSDF